jgi:hypothetical protein
MSCRSYGPLGLVGPVGHLGPVGPVGSLGPVGPCRSFEIKYGNST